MGLAPLKLALIVAVSVAWPGQVAAGAPDYAAARQQAKVLERDGRHGQAADALQSVAGAYPQDYALALELAALRLAAGQYREAARHYRRAAELSDNSTESRLGLAWALLRGGEREQAGQLFADIVDQHPDQAGASAGLRLARRPSFDLYPSTALTFHHYAGHPAKAWAIGNAVSLEARLGESFILGGVYRYTHFAVHEAPAAMDTLVQAQSTAGGDMTPPAGWAGSATTSGGTQTQTANAAQGDLVLRDFAQHEVYLHAGPAFRSWGLTGHYAYLHDASGTFGGVQVAGLVGRLSLWGDLLAEGSASFYDDAHVYRGELAWRLPLTSWLSLQPAGAVQRAADESLFNGALTAYVALGPTVLWVGGKLGEELRPAYLSRAVVYNIADRIRFGGWAGVQLTLGTHWRLYAAYELQRLEQRIDDVERQSNAHFTTLGFAFTFSELW